MRLTSPRASLIARVSAYTLVLAITHGLFSRFYFSVDFLGQRAALWSLCFIPLFTLTLQMALLRWLPLYAFAALLGLDAVADLAVATHWAYFGSAPSILNLMVAIREASVGILQAGGFVPRGLLPFLALKTALLFLLARSIKPRLPGSGIVWGNLATGSMLGFAFLMRPPAEAARPYAYEICIKTHGLYTATLSELAFRNAFLASLPSIQDQKTRKLAANTWNVSADYLRSILVLQVESLDWEVLGFHHQGVPATPFLNSIRDQSLLLKLNPMHSSISGSSGADFQFLAMISPPHRRLALRGDDLESIPSLPRSLSKKGIRTVAMHGNTGAFWSRSYAYPRLGVSRLFEKKDYPSADGGWGVSDQTFFDFNARLINTTADPTLFFMITLSSHAPFRWVRDGVFPDRGAVPDYLNSIHYADRSLGRFFSQLRGKHLVILYGDHASNVQDATYNSRPQGKEFVPGMVFLLDEGRVSSPHFDAPPADLLEGCYDIRTLGLWIQSITNSLPAQGPTP